MFNHFKNLNKHIPPKENEVVIGLAVYHQDRVDWVRQSVESILNQTYQKFILIVVIDGDICDDIIEYLQITANKSSQIFLFKSDLNVGLSACMNHCIDWTSQFSPRYFFRMDADDVAESSRLAKQINFLQSNPEVSILGSALTEIDEVGNIVGKRKLPLNHDEIIKFLPKRCSLNHPTVVFRFNVFEDGYRYREHLRNTQDYFFWIELAASGYRFANLSEQLLRFRRVNDFYKRRGLKKSINEFKARFFAMRVLNKFNLGNVLYAFSVLTLRLMPSIIVKFAYKLDRLFLEKYIKH